MNEEDKIARFAELEARARADETDWETFFQAAEAWEDLVGPAPEVVVWNDAWHTWYRWISQRAWEYQRKSTKPGLWERLHTKITKRG